MQSCGRLWCYFGAFPSQSWRVSASIHNCGWNMDTQLHSRDKGTVNTVDFWRQTGSEEGEDGEIGRQGDSHGFLECTRNHLHRLLGKKINDNWSLLCVVIAPVKRRNQEKTSLFEKDPFPSRQYTGADLRSFDDQNYGIKIRIIITSIWITGFGPKWLSFYFQTWKNVSADNGSDWTRRLSSEQMPILRTFRNQSINIVVAQTLSQETPLKIRTIFYHSRNRIENSNSCAVLFGILSNFWLLYWIIIN